ncbi:DUF6113 family protein [Nonomuraea sp. NPDC059194]|uniref:DUF6113 family protein n=1 Tax=Nonomuraea sp. NPDC059194 TaxID=3346764 RepID=UPI00368DAFB0
MEQRSHAESALAGAAYGMLAVLGVALGVVGGFTHAWYVGDSWPLAAIAWVPAMFGLCFGAGRMMRSKLGAAAVAVGWLLVSMVFSLKRAAGDLVIAGDSAGFVYLYGAMVAVVVAVLLSPSSGGSWLLRGVAPHGPMTPQGPPPQGPMPQGPPMPQPPPTVDGGR